MKVFVTGACGMLGTEVCREFKRLGDDVTAVDLKTRSQGVQEVDICQWRDIERVVDAARPQVIFHLAAETNVDLCEEKPDHAYRVNTLGTENMALLAQRYDLPMVYISTAGVFNGAKDDPYTEFDEPDPINVYGRSKYEGEKAVRRLVKKFFIFRAGWMIGGWTIDKKFVYKIVQQILGGAREVRAVSDKFGSPTFTFYFAKNAIEVFKTDRHGLYHLCGQGTCSRYDLARKVVEFLGFQDRVKVFPVASDQFPLPAPRPRSEMMRNYKLDLLGMNRMPTWQEALREYVATNTPQSVAV